MVFDLPSTPINCSTGPKLIPTMALNFSPPTRNFSNMHVIQLLGAICHIFSNGYRRYLAIGVTLYVCISQIFSCGSNSITTAVCLSVCLSVTHFHVGSNIKEITRLPQLMLGIVLVSSKSTINFVLTI